jgi:hypothetical protein
MQLRYALMAILSLWLGAAAHAGDLSDFHAAAEKVSAHNRVAIGYLRTGNRDLARLELDRMQAAWKKLFDRFSTKPPDAFSDSDLYSSTLADVSKHIAAATNKTEHDQSDEARDLLLGVRQALSRLRRSSGMYIFVDCVIDANAAMDALFVYKDNPPDWAKHEIRNDLASKAAVYAHELRRCDQMAAAALRTSPEFRRVVDGALAGLALVPRAIARRDGDLLYRILVELRSFDNLLAFRYG